jgi:competence protein ComEC
VREPAALPEDCRRADIVISVDSIRVDCGAKHRIDWRDRRRRGAHALWVGEDGSMEIIAVDDLRGRRPWVGAAELPSTARDAAPLEIERLQR